jgi:hypothetical protein
LCRALSISWTKVQLHDRKRFGTVLAPTPNKMGDQIVTGMASAQIPVIETAASHVCDIIARALECHHAVRLGKK